MNWNRLTSTMKIRHLKNHFTQLSFSLFVQWHLQELVFPIPSNTKLYHLQTLAEGTNKTMAAQNGAPRITQHSKQTCIRLRETDATQEKK